MREFFYCICRSRYLQQTPYWRQAEIEYSTVHDTLHDRGTTAAVLSMARSKIVKTINEVKSSGVCFKSQNRRRRKSKYIPLMWFPREFFWDVHMSRICVQDYHKYQTQENGPVTQYIECCKKQIRRQKN